MVIGISVRSPERAPSNVEIIGNTITNLLGTNAECDGGDGIQRMGKNSLVHGNSITQQDEEFSLNGISIQGAQSVGNQISRNIISGNFIHSIYATNNVPLGTLPSLAGFQQIVLNEATGAGIHVANAAETNVSGNTLTMSPRSIVPDAPIVVHQAPFTIVHRNFIRFDSNEIYDAGILVNESAETRVDSNDIERTAAMGDDYQILNAVFVRNSNLTQIEKNLVAEGLANTGIRAQSTTGLFVRDNEIRDVESFMLHLSANSHEALISDNLMIKSAQGMMIQNSNQAIIEGNTLQQVANAGMGIHLDNADQATIRFNSVETPTCGVKIETTSADAIVATNTIRYKRGTGTPGVNYGGICGTALHASDNSITEVP